MAKYYNKKAMFQTDSKWESQLHDNIFSQVKDCKYHPCRIDYVVSSTYQPDWSIQRGDKTIYIEAKGHFKDNQEMRKYKFIREALTEHEELVFLFMKPNQKIHFRKKRKDGTTQTYSEWATLNKFLWFDEETIREIL